TFVFCCVLRLDRIHWPGRRQQENPQKKNAPAQKGSQSGRKLILRSGKGWRCSEGISPVSKEALRNSPALGEFRRASFGTRAWSPQACQGSALMKSSAWEIEALISAISFEISDWMFIASPLREAIACAFKLC